MRFDFHVHSVYSDGDFAVEDLARMAKEAGLGGFALTDHDTTEGWRDITAAVNKYGVTIVPGVEISTEWEEKDVHILAFGLTEASHESLALLERIRKGRVERIRDMVKKCRAKGFSITEEGVFAIAGEGSPGRPHVAKALVAEGCVENTGEAFRKYLYRGGPCYAPRDKISPFLCVEMVRAEGGFPVLAHPGIDGNFRIAAELKQHGLWGLEVYHSSHSPGEEQRFLALSEELGLKAFAGSDFHGFHQDGHGNMGSKYRELKSSIEMFR